MYSSYKAYNFFNVQHTGAVLEWQVRLMISMIGDNLFDSYLLSQLLCSEKCLTDSLSEGMAFFNPIRQDVLKLLLFMKKDYISKGSLSRDR